MDLCEPFFETSNDSCKVVVASDKFAVDTHRPQSDFLNTDSLIGAFSTVSIVEYSDKINESRQVNVRTSDASDAHCFKITCPSPRRSGRISKLNKNTEVRKGRKPSKNKALLDLSSLNITRRRRSCSCKQARSSSWALLGSFTSNIEHNTEVATDKRKHKKPKKQRSDLEGRRRDKNQTGGNLERLDAKTFAPSGRICLKFKLGKKVDQCHLEDMVPSSNIDPDKYCGSRTEVLKSMNDIDGKSDEDVPKVFGSNEKSKEDELVASILCAQEDDKGNLEKLNYNAMDHNESKSLVLDERLEVTTNDVCLDPGTSPDSEVININPDVQVCRRPSEDLQDVLICPHSFAASGSFMGLRLPKISFKTGKKKGDFHRPSNCSMQSKQPCSGITDNQEPREKMDDGSYGSETSVSNATGNVSANISSNDVQKVENNKDFNLCSATDNGHESLESQRSQKPLSLTKGRKIPKSLRSRRGSKIKSDATDSKSRNKNSCGQRGSQAKPIGEHKVKEKSGIELDDGRSEHCPETSVQTHKMDSHGDPESGKRSLDEEINLLAIAPSGAKEQHVSLRDDAWVRCDDCFKWRRISAALADFIEETNCSWVCMDNMDKNYADCSIPQEMSNEEINEELGISEVCEEDGRGTHLSCYDRKQLKDGQQSSWVHIKSNLFLHRTRKDQTIDEVMVCHCKPSPDGRKGCGDGCLNRMLNIECVQGTCPCGELCSNQQFQERKYAKLRWFRCGKKGYGLQLLEDVKKGKFLIEYVGEVLDLHVYETRQREYASKGHKHFYFMTLNGSEVIDACAKGNLGRFINHSCDPNCRTEKWMVNGEVCIGLFALRDIKEGEEVTFDYNYVRVFGAAAKKCVCGSPQCRGFIGGDPVNSEVIVQGDSDEEYPEPIMICEDGPMDDYLKSISSLNSSFDCTEVRTAENITENRDKRNAPATTNAHFEVSSGAVKTAVKDKNEPDFSADVIGKTTESRACITSPTFRVPTESNLESDVTGKATFRVSEFSKEENIVIDPSSCAKTSNTALMTTHDKTFTRKTESKSKSKNKQNEDKNVESNALPFSKTRRPSFSVKKVKPKSMHAEKSPDVESKSCSLAQRTRKIPNGSFSGRFEAVEEKLNELLDLGGGISKRKDASRGYLKLLFLTAASGDNGNGEAIQSNRDLSMILDALLKTKSRTVLVDIINKNGLQMLHNIMKRSRKEYNRIPILRKLLKVLEYLAMREILTTEHINGGPPCPGVVSFRESMLSLTEHIDKQVHQIARNFRDKWIPRHLRKNGCTDRDDKMELHRAVSCNVFNPLAGATEGSGCLKQLPSISVVDARVQEEPVSCSPCLTNGTMTRKRKSRWDQPAESSYDAQYFVRKEPRIHPNNIEALYSDVLQKTGEVVSKHNNGIRDESKDCFYVHNFYRKIESAAHDGRKPNDDNDAPPGFSYPLNCNLVRASFDTDSIGHCKERVSYVNWPCQVVVGHHQVRFISRLSVSYGIPMSLVQEFGTFEAGCSESWVVAPGVPFHPFPPLPSYQRQEIGSASPTSLSACQPAEQAEQDCHHNVEHAEREWQNSAELDDQSWKNSASCSELGTVSTLDATTSGTTNLCENNGNKQRTGSLSYNLGRKYFRQQKWSNSKLVPPWIRRRNGLGFIGNNARNGAGSGGNEFRSSFDMENASGGVEDPTSHQH